MKSPMYLKTVIASPSFYPLSGGISLIGIKQRGQDRAGAPKFPCKQIWVMFGQTISVGLTILGHMASSATIGHFGP